MDLMYLPDAFTYHVIRSPAYDSREYLEPVWRQQAEEEARRRHKGKRTTTPCPNEVTPHRSGSGGHQQKRGQGGAKDACPLCRERKRRTLAAYIRTKSRQDSECTIEEEEGEEEGAKEGNPAKEPEGTAS